VLGAGGEAQAATSETVWGSRANENTKKNTAPHTQARPSDVERGTFEKKIVFKGIQAFHTSACVVITWRLAPMLQGSLI
jgi:hypothetical protein